MIFITGDTHGDFTRFNTDIFYEQKEMTKDDCVIVCGDFGGVWDYKGESPREKYWLDWLESKPFTTLFVDGNHENHVRLFEYPEIEWNGGKVHEIRPSVLHMMRGEIFQIEGLSFFTFGGASSHDIQDGVLDPEKDKDLIKKWRYVPYKMYRIIGQSWWKEELPSEEEMQHGFDTLEKYGNKVDYIITHSPSASEIALLGHGAYQQDVLTKYLEEVKARTDYKKHFCGHMHVNKAMNEKDIILYEQIIRIF